MLSTGVFAVNILTSKLVREGRYISTVCSLSNTKMVFLMIGQTSYLHFSVPRLFHLDSCSPLLSFPVDMLAPFSVFVSLLFGLRGREIFLRGSFFLCDKQYEAQK